MPLCLEAASRVKIFVAQMLTHDLFVVADMFTGRTPLCGISRYLNLLTSRKSAFWPHRGDLLH